MDISAALDPSGSETASKITRGLVQLVKEHVGRGPLGAHTHLVDGLVVTVLEDCMTRSEQTLVEAGKVAEVKELRLHLQAAFAAPAVALVEGATGRTVRSFMSDHDVLEDVAAEVFVLEPEAPAPAA